MLEILKMLGIGFSVGLTGALVPGPMLFATIETSLKKGWTSGPLVVSGHALVEVMLFIFIVAGFSTLATQGAILWISVIGGAVLVVFGILTIKEGKNATFSGDSSVFKSPFAAGVITSVSHPYFWLWWLTAGAGLVLMGLETIPGNIIRPRLMMQHGNIHPIITLLSFTAPLFVVGAMGIIIGPAAYGFMLALYRTYTGFEVITKSGNKEIEEKAGTQAEDENPPEDKTQPGDEIQPEVKTQSGDEIQSEDKTQSGDKT